MIQPHKDSRPGFCPKSPPTEAMQRCIKWLRRRSAVASLAALVVVSTLLLAHHLLKNVPTELPLQATLQGQTKINVAVFSPDGKTVATAEADRTIKLWDVETGLERAALAWKPVLQRAGGLDGTLHFSPDSATLATAGFGDKGIALKLWNVATGQECATFKGHSRIRSVVFSPDGKTAVLEGLEDAVMLRDAATGRKRATLKTKEVLRVANGIQPVVILSLDGKTILTAGTDGTIKLWEAATGRERAALQRPVMDLRKAVFSPDGKNLVTMEGKDRTVKLWDVATGRERAKLITINEPGPRGEHDLIFSPDGKILATHENYNLRLWDVATANQRQILRRVAYLKFSPDGKRLVTGMAFTSKLWDMAARKQLAVFPEIHQAVFTPDGKILATVNKEVADGKTLDGIVKLWDAATGRLLDTLKLKGQAKEHILIAFSSDGKTLVTGGQSLFAGAGVFRLWDVATRKERATLTELTNQLREWKLSPDGETLAVRLADTVQLWEVATGKQRAILKKTDTLLPTSVMLFSPDGKTLATGGVATGVINGEIKLWDVATGQLRAALERAGRTPAIVVFNPNSKTVATSAIGGTRLGMGSIKLWDVATGRELAAFPSVESVSFSPESDTLVTVGTDVTVKLWDVATAQESAALERPIEGIREMRFSPHGKTLAAMIDSHDPSQPRGQPEIDTVKLWDTATGKERATLNGGGEAVFSADGKTLATTKKNVTKLWDVATGKERIAHWNQWFLAFSPDSKILATVSGGTIKLRDVATGQERAVLEGVGEALLDPDGKVVGTQAVFSPDGKILATQSFDESTVKLWDVATGKKRATLKGRGKVVFSPDGKILATEPRGGIHLWDVATGKERGALTGQWFMAFSLDSSLLATSDDIKDIRLWRLSPKK